MKRPGCKHPDTERDGLRLPAIGLTNSMSCKPSRTATASRHSLHPPICNTHTHHQHHPIPGHLLPHLCQLPGHPGGAQQRGGPPAARAHAARRVAPPQQPAARRAPGGFGMGVNRRRNSERTGRASEHCRAQQSSRCGCGLGGRGRVREGEEGGPRWVSCRLSSQLRDMRQVGLGVNRRPHSERTGRASEHY